MQFKTAALAGVSVVLSVGSVAGCSRSGPGELEIIAPAFETSRLRFASYGYTPVGAFAAKRGDVVPFMDANGDGRFDPQAEASGRCDRASHKCWFDHARLRLLTTASDCEGSAGTWVFGNVYDRGGHGLDTTLCDDRGACAEAHPDAFSGAPSFKAIWVPIQPDAPEPPRALTLRAGAEAIEYTDIELPPSITVLDSKVDQPGDLDVSITVDQSIDMASLSARRGPDVQWTSPASGFHVEGGALEATVPKAVLDRCGPGCEVTLQVAHVWRDDNVFALAETKQKVL